MQLSCCAALLLVSGAAAAQPPTVPAEPDEAVMRYPPSSVRVGLIAGGLSLTAGTYLAAFLSGTVWDDVPGADALKVPVVGPWVALAQSGCGPGQDSCAAELVLRTILTVLDGLAQVGGVGIAAEGIFMTTEAEGPDAVAEGSSDGRSGLQISAVPFIAPEAAGIGLYGRF